MGSINIDNTGSGADVTLSSDGTDLLLDGTAVGGGGGASAYTIENKTAAYTVVAGDLGKIINCSSGTFTISLTSAATLGAGWYCWIYNTDDGASNFAVTIDPDGSETIGFKSTIVLRQLEGVKIVSDGTNWLVGDDRKSLFFQQNYRAGFFTPPSATGLLSTAIGRGATSSADDSFAAGSGSAGSGAKAAGNGSVVLGNAYSSGSDGFAAAISNNTSSYGATGANSIAMGYQAKATGDDSIAIGEASRSFGNFRPLAVGYNAYASQSYSTAIGPYTQATNTNCLAIGYTAYATGYGAIAVGYATSDAARSIAIGERSRTNGIAGAIVFSNGTNQSGNVGDSQAGIYILKGMTTDATPLVLTTNGTTAGSDDQLILVNNSAYSFHGTIVARQQSSQGTASAAWKIEGLIRREGTAATTTLVNSATTVLDNTPSWGMALSADTTNGCLKVQVTGAASTNIKWNGAIHTSETYYT